MSNMLNPDQNCLKRQGTEEILENFREFETNEKTPLSPKQTSIVWHKKAVLA